MGVLRKLEDVARVAERSKASDLRPDGEHLRVGSNPHLVQFMLRLDA